MSFVDRTYPDIVRDVLTSLTQGVSREQHHVSYDPSARPLQVPDIVLTRRPVQRVSLIEGMIEPTPGAELMKYTFGLNDYELVHNPDDPDDQSRIRFVPFGKKPANDTELSINYFPRNKDKTPVTDLNVGSVARTLLEAVSRELALLYSQLNLVYDSAFLETASGASLDRVVALLGYRRFRAGRPVGAVTFSRRTGATGSITIPAGTPITDTADKVRYETVETRAMDAGESTALVGVRGSAENTPVVEPGVLSVIQRAIAGLDTVLNERPTTRASDDETDVELRARARDALLASNKGTVSAIKYGLLQMPEVRDVQVTEMPNGVPGEIAMSISLVQPPPGGALPRSVQARIEELRPAGIRVVTNSAGSAQLQAHLTLTLAGSHLPDADITQLHQSVSRLLAAEVAKKGLGEKLRNRALVAAILRDERMVDAALTLARKGGPSSNVGDDYQADAGSASSLAAEDVVFGADAFDKPLSADSNIGVEVRASLGAKLLPGVSMEQVKAQLAARLTNFFESLSAGTSVTADALLLALRDDGKYAIDPLKLLVTLSSIDQFVQIQAGGAAFQVLPGQVFTVAAVDVSAQP